MVDGLTEVGADTVIHPFAHLGGPPQHIAHKGEETQLLIGERNLIREQVTMHCGTVLGGGVTRVGADGVYYVGAHVAHDCIVGANVIPDQPRHPGRACEEVGDFAILGGLAGVHQRGRVGRYAFVGAGAIVTKDVIPYGSVWGNHAHLEGLNLVGLRRRGFSRDAINELRAAYRLLFAPEGTFQERLEDASVAYAHSPRGAGDRELHPHRRLAPHLPAGNPEAHRAVDKLGLIAGGGELPVALAARCAAVGRPLFVVRLRGFAGDGLAAYDGAACGLGEFGRCFGLLRGSGVTSVCFAGNVAMPDFAKLMPDWRGLAILPALATAALKGDDALLRAVLKAFEGRGFPH